MNTAGRVERVDLTLLAHTDLVGRRIGGKEIAGAAVAATKIGAHVHALSSLVGRGNRNRKVRLVLGARQNPNTMRRVCHGRVTGRAQRMKTTLLVSISLGLSALVAGCSGTNPIAGPTPPALIADIVRVSGDSQLGTVHSALASPIVVRILDDRNQPIRGKPVSWVVTQGGGYVFTPAALSDTAGLVPQQWFLGDIAGVQSLEARAYDSLNVPIVVARFVAIAQPGPLVSATWTGPRRMIWFADSALALPMNARDAYGNAVTRPAPTSPDTGTGAFDSTWTPQRLGHVRFVLGLDTLHLLVLPPPARYMATRTSGADTIIESGRWRIDMVSPWQAPSAFCAEAEATVQLSADSAQSIRVGVDTVRQTIAMARPSLSYRVCESGIHASHHLDLRGTTRPLSLRSTSPRRWVLAAGATDSVVVSR